MLVIATYFLSKAIKYRILNEFSIFLESILAVRKKV